MLILGSMPGKASLMAQQYYAHPRNAFWKIMAEVFRFDAALPYESRVAKLASHEVAVWDVIQICTRSSSLDSDIVASSVVPNNFREFFAEHHRLQRVCLNGGKAAQLFRRHVTDRLPAAERLEIFELPSTSPAHAAMSFEQKLQRWQLALS
jgi:double-stranded uracil-DNA glycosylase